MPGTPLPKHPRVVPFTDTDVAELENACSQLRSALREMILDANFVKMSADSEAPSTPKVPSPKNISGLADDDDAELHSPRSRLMSGHTAKATASIASEYRRTTTLDRWGGNKAVLDLSNVDEETAVEGGESSPTAAPSPKRLNARRKTIVDQMSTWDPDLLSLSHADLCLMVHESIAQSGLIEQLSLEEDACGLRFAVLCSGRVPEPYVDLLERLQLESAKAVPTVHCLSRADQGHADGERLASYFGDQAMVTWHGAGRAMPSAADCKGVIAYIDKAAPETYRAKRLRGGSTRAHVGATSRRAAIDDP